MMLCQIDTIACLLINIPPVIYSYADATTSFCVRKKVRMGPFSFGLGVSVGFECCVDISFRADEWWDQMLGNNTEWCL